MADFNIAIMGEQASGKTTAVRFLKDLHLEKRYFRTFSAEVHPFEYIEDKGRLVVLWDMPPENYEKYMGNMDAALYVTKKKMPPALDIGHVIVNNKNYQMDRETLHQSLKTLYEIIL
jgi:hypothetical protein